MNEEVEATTEVFRFRIADITPVPQDDVLAAITAALNEAWPLPSAEPTTGLRPLDSHWRFGQRRWRSRQIPRQSWGRSA